MKKTIFLMSSILLFSACNNEDLDLDAPWNNGEIEFAETDLSVKEVLSSAEFWIDNYTDRYFYTEPNGKGESLHPDEYPLGGDVSLFFSIISGNIRLYTSANPPMFIGYYTDHPIKEISKDKIIFNNGVKDVCLKVLDYDEASVLIEAYDYLNFMHPDFPYCITVLKRGTPSNPNWKDEFLSYEEYLKAEEEWQNRYNQ